MPALHREALQAAVLGIVRVNRLLELLEVHAGTQCRNESAEEVVHHVHAAPRRVDATHAGPIASHNVKRDTVNAHADVARSIVKLAALKSA